MEDNITERLKSENDAPTPLLSVVIATRNRQKYCTAAIESLFKMDKGRELQIAISDNSDSDSLSNYVKILNDPRIVYTYTQEQLSFIDNFNKVTELATGKYICLIGDDDTLLPEIIEHTKWALEKDVDSFTFKFLNYYWPQEDDITQNGYLILEKQTEKQFKVDVEEQLNALVKNGFVNYLGYNLPKVYHGVVKMSLLQEIKNKTGSFYGGLSPDIYASVALSTVVKNHYHIDKYLSIAGACPASATAKAPKGGHCGVLQSAPHFKGREFYKWNVEVPEYYSVETIWADSGISALKDLNQPQLLKKYNPYKLLVWAIYINRKYILKLSLRQTFRWRKDNKVSFFVFFGKLLSTLSAFFVKKFLKSKKNKNEQPKIIYGISDIEQACKCLADNSPVRKK